VFEAPGIDQHVTVADGVRIARLSDDRYGQPRYEIQVQCGVRDWQRHRPPFANFSAALSAALSVASCPPNQRGPEPPLQPTPMRDYPGSDIEQGHASVRDLDYRRGPLSLAARCRRARSEVGWPEDGTELSARVRGRADT